MKSEFEDKVILVTGGVQGIGKIIAIEFAKSKSKVIIADINMERGEQTIAEIQDLGSDAIFIKTDITIKKEVESLIEKIVNLYGRLDCAINNAGATHKKHTTIDDCSEQEYDNIIDVNLKGTWLCMKYQINQMKKQYGGTIINLSSILGISGIKELPIYSTSKAGIIQLTKTAAAQYADMNIRINAIAPGFIDSPLVSSNIKPSQFFIKNFIPMKRQGTLQECAKTIMFLCSKDASYITGQTLVMDGGFLTRIF